MNKSLTQIKIKDEAIAVIPARVGSKRIKGKNIRELNGQPLLSYSILDALRCKNIKGVYVSTDGVDISQIALKYGAEIISLRPSILARDDSIDIEWVAHFLQSYQEKFTYFPKYLVHLRPTTPIRDPIIIDEAIDKIKLFKESTSLRSIEEVSESPYKMFKEEKFFLIPAFDGKHFFNTGNIKEWEFYNMPNQAFPITYKANGYVDIIKTETIVQNSLHGDKILAYKTPPSPEIDKEEDFQYCEFLLDKLSNE